MSSSRANARPPILGIFPTSTSLPSASGPPPSIGSSSSSHGIATGYALSSTAKILRRPKTVQSYGDGTELDGIADPVVENEKERLFRMKPKTSSSTVVATSVTSKEKQPSSSNSTSTGTIGRTPGVLSLPVSTPASTSTNPMGKRPPSGTSIRNPASDSFAMLVFDMLVFISPYTGYTTRQGIRNHAILTGGQLTR
ncbi:hypothetical protein BS47DRAFT_1397462 [Hydnum rufescens UP504]|uniref:Uncharacterized protein n=1 Tax=Hydnum rufescens UP504 TaxID=1448309 RepID=A0A9P6DNC8_9AGAM|nr:hypothetical protein BS47DRAFT_1397462 [Hydnum rufescens UP504]